MRDIDLFQIALGLTPPWQVLSSDFDPQQKRLDIQIDFPRGSTFSCPTCKQDNVKAYDTETKIWRHLNFFQHETYLTARVPRVQCDQCGLRVVVHVMAEIERRKKLPARITEEPDLFRTPLEHMLAVMRDKTAEPARRDKMTIAAAPFIHARAEATPGKKEEKQEAANKVLSGKFAPSKGPKVVPIR